MTKRGFNMNGRELSLYPRVFSSPAGLKLSRSRRLMRVMFAVVLCGTVPLAGLAATDAEDAPPRVTVHEERGVYAVSAQFHVPDAPAVALAVLTDYDEIP